MGMIWHHYLRYVPKIKRHADQFLRIRRLARLALLPVGHRRRNVHDGLLWLWRTGIFQNNSQRAKGYETQVATLR